MTQVFISYSRKDLKFVEGLASDLKKAGFEVWYDYLRLQGGERWRIEIQNALKASQYVIAVLSPDSVASEWVEREFLYASNLERRIIPLLYRDCELPLNYMDLNYIDVRGENYQRNFGKILEVLNQNSGKTPIYTSSKAKSSTFNEHHPTDRSSLLRKWLPIFVLFCLSLSVAAVWLAYAAQRPFQPEPITTTLTNLPSLEPSTPTPVTLVTAAPSSGPTMTPSVTVGAIDTDGDGLTDAEEYTLGSDSFKRDSDDDTVDDGQEVRAGTNPTRKDPEYYILAMDIASTDHVYAWYKNNTRSEGTTPNLGEFGLPRQYILPSGYSPSNIIEIGITCLDANDYVYIWYDNGNVGSGNTTDLGARLAPSSYSLPPGKVYSDIVGISISSIDVVYAWYRDGTVSYGSSSDFDEASPAYKYTVASGKSPADIISIGIACSNDYIYTWYKDGTVSVGNSSDLDSIQEAYPYTFP